MPNSFFRRLADGRVLSGVWWFLAERTSRLRSGSVSGLAASPTEEWFDGTVGDSYTEKAVAARALSASLD